MERNREISRRISMVERGPKLNPEGSLLIEAKKAFPGSTEANLERRSQASRYAGEIRPKTAEKIRRKIRSRCTGRHPEEENCGSPKCKVRVTKLATFNRGVAQILKKAA